MCELLCCQLLKPLYVLLKAPYVLAGLYCHKICLDVTAWRPEAGMHTSGLNEGRWS